MSDARIGEPWSSNHCNAAVLQRAKVQGQARSTALDGLLRSSWKLLKIWWHPLVKGTQAGNWFNETCLVSIHGDSNGLEEIPCCGQVVISTKPSGDPELNGTRYTCEGLINDVPIQYLYMNIYTYGQRTPHSPTTRNYGCRMGVLSRRILFDFHTGIQYARR